MPVLALAPPLDLSLRLRPSLLFSLGIYLSLGYPGTTAPRTSAMPNAVLRHIQTMASHIIAVAGRISLLVLVVLFHFFKP